MVPIMEYLEVRNEEAFTYDEVLDALIEVYGRQATPAEVVLALEDLVSAGRLESKQISGVWRYTLARE